MTAAACASACTLVCVGDRLGAQPDLLRLGLGLADPRVARRGGERGLPVRLGVGRLAHVDLELLLLLLRPAARRRGSARSTTAWCALASASGPCWAASWVALSTSAWKPAFLMLVSRTDSAICACGGLLLADRLALGVGARDAGVLLDLRLVRRRRGSRCSSTGCVIAWIWKLSMTRPNDSISCEQRSRTCCANLSWSLIMSSTVIEPAMARR